MHCTRSNSFSQIPLQLFSPEREPRDTSIRLPIIRYFFYAQIKSSIDQLEIHFFRNVDERHFTSYLEIKNNRVLFQCRSQLVILERETSHFRIIELHQSLQSRRLNHGFQQSQNIPITIRETLQAESGHQ